MIITTITTVNSGCHNGRNIVRTFNIFWNDNISGTGSSPFCRIHGNIAQSSGEGGTLERGITGSGAIFYSKVEFLSVSIVHGNLIIAAPGHFAIAGN